ncbi:hypothetical protein EG329_008206 [Mollisiaceae sp. DMI_Dod_QoI]|nr:hypothetical protein EG329_008206 [Helotiales sp. DMI_Dod_QoI]
MGQLSKVRRPGVSAARPKMGNQARTRLLHLARKTKTKIKKVWSKLNRVNLPADDEQSDTMPLRRSIRGSLESLRSVRSSQSSVINDALLPALVDARRSLSSLGRPSPLAASVTSLRAVEEESQASVPEIDREVDLMVASDEPCIQEDLDKALDTVIPAWSGATEGYPTQKLDPNGPLFPWFKLPPKCKRIIFEFCFPPEQRKVSLSKESFTEAVFPKGYFASPWDILDPVWGALGSCQAWRNEVLAYFWSQYHFHITLNEFTGKFTCPLSHIWVLPHLHLIQRLTIERDFTRLAGSNHKAASQLTFKVANKVRDMMESIVKGLLDRPADTKMAELHLMARKYAGFRPKEHFAKGSADIDSAWPTLSPSPLITIYNPSTKAPSSISPSSISLQLDVRSDQKVTWAKETEEELYKWARKMSATEQDQNYTTAQATEDTIVGVPSSSGTLADHVRSCQALPPASLSNYSTTGRATASQDPSVPRSVNNDKTMPPLEIEQYPEHSPDFIPDGTLPTELMAEQTQEDTTLHQAKPAHTGDVTRNEAFDNTDAQTLAGMNELNKQIEQDPAFQRTIDAMKRLSQKDKGDGNRHRSTTIPPPRSPSSQKASVNRATTTPNQRPPLSTRRSLFGIFAGFNGARTPRA